MNQFKIQNSKFKIKDSHATCGWGFYLPWETMILSRANATANAPLAGVRVAGRSTVLNLTSFHKEDKGDKGDKGEL
ncbi:hypothetical protein [Nostoc sp.]|uniref:hypothetical protein n=1 Tax=Nostoc sp. TaxID=1180 RepID=UPI002FF514E7